MSDELWNDLIGIQIHSGRLLSDFAQIGSPGAALLNAGLVGLLGLVLIKVNGIPLSGPTFAAVLTMAGFGLFGKTPLNITPIIFGVWISSILARKSFSEYLMIALFGTALGPFVTSVVYSFALPLAGSIALALVAGVLTGILLPPVAIAMLRLHQGYNLYNMGLTAGFFSLFLAAILFGFGADFSTELYWYSDVSIPLALFVPALSLVLLVAGLILERGASFANLAKLLKLSGRLPSDFMFESTPGSALINSGLLGLVLSAYVFFSGSDFNGPVIGGLMTVIGFGAFGTHLKNAWPVIAGVVSATLLTGNSLNSPGPILAALFSTTLAPIAGQFGPVAGFISGFIHLILVLQTAGWSGGINLYNNGFAGGFTATLIIAVIQWYTNSREA